MNPLESAYYIGHALATFIALRTQKTLPARVISVGNITVGGTGKTPAAIAIASEALRRGFSPVILTRGYRGRAKGPCFVSRGSGPLLSADEAGDEPVVMSDRLRGVPIVKCADRYRGGLFALAGLSDAERSSVLFVLDDGFQHRGLKRDVDVVLVDGTAPLSGSRLLPTGRLREPLTALRRAHYLVITKVRNETVKRELGVIHPNGGIFFSEYRARGLRNNQGVLMPVDSLKTASVFAFCGIARPESFRKTLSPLCASVRGFRAFADHHAYCRRDVDTLIKGFTDSGADFLVTTEKDAVKLRETSVIGRLLVLEIDFLFDDSFLDALFGRLT